MTRVDPSPFEMDTTWAESMFDPVLEMATLQAPVRRRGHLNLVKASEPALAEALKDHGAREQINHLTQELMDVLVEMMDIVDGDADIETDEADLEDSDGI